MTHVRGIRQPRLAAVVLATLVAGLMTVLSPAPAHAATTPLVGVFALDPGKVVSGKVKGSYFRMVQAGGTIAAGPYLENFNSSLADKTYTPFTPGTDGGLRTGAYQPQPATPFDGDGGSLAGRIIDPTPFFGVNFGVSTNATDLQTKTATALPTISVDGAGKLSGDLRAFDASWNSNQFNQGSPKPNGNHPGLTKDVRGTYDASTGRYSLDWSSLIVGGPFDKFTGTWHFEGTFTQPGTAPKVGPVTRTATGFKVPITNLDAATTYRLKVSVGKATRSGKTVTVSGLKPGKAATLEISAKKPGSATTSRKVTGKALAKGVAPTYSAVTRTAGGFRFTIKNYAAGTTYRLATTAGKVKRSGAKVTASGLKKGAKAVVTVTASKAGSTSASTKLTGTAG